MHLSSSLPNNVYYLKKFKNHNVREVHVFNFFFYLGSRSSFPLSSNKSLLRAGSYWKCFTRPILSPTNYLSEKNYEKIFWKRCSERDFSKKIFSSV